MSIQRIPYKKVVIVKVRESYSKRLNEALDVAYKELSMPTTVRRMAKYIMNMDK